MSFLESLGLDAVKGEKDMLFALRGAAEGWYNELTEPFLSILRDDEEGSVPSDEAHLRLTRLANEMLRAELLINDGDALNNKLAEIDKSTGIPFFSGREDLRAKAVYYLNCGKFLKELARPSFRRANLANDYRAAVRDAREGWQQFRSAKDALVEQINTQLASIG